MSKDNRVVITGLGTITPMGYGADNLFEGIKSARNVIKQMPQWSEYDGLNCLLAAPCEIKNEKAIPRKHRRSMSPMSIMAVQSADEALNDAGISKDMLNNGRCGCVSGSTMGSAKVINEAYELVLPEKDFTKLTSMMFFKCMAHSVAANLAQYLSLSGIVMATSAACASSLQAIGLGYDLIKAGRQDLMICGGAEEIHPTVTGIFDLLFATSIHYNDDPENSPRPFDAKRDGLVCGEGAAMLVLESLEHAKARNAKIYAEVIGYNTAGSGEHVSQSNTQAMVRCMSAALEDANINSSQIDYINAHATGTKQGDAAEVAAINEVFGDSIPTSSLKGYIGHTLGASGGIELIVSLLMMKNNILLPGKNLQEISEDCKGVNHIRKPEERDIQYIIKNGFAFGGVNASIICKKFQ